MRAPAGGPTTRALSLVPRTRRWQRLLEVVPAALLVVTVASLALLALIAPTALFLLGAAYVLFWTARSVEMGVRQVVELVRVRRFARIDWTARLAG